MVVCSKPICPPAGQKRHIQELWPGMFCGCPGRLWVRHPGDCEGLSMSGEQKGRENAGLQHLCVLQTPRGGGVPKNVAEFERSHSCFCCLFFASLFSSSLHLQGASFLNRSIGRAELRRIEKY
jgi:hypothetical protein